METDKPDQHFEFGRGVRAFFTSLLLAWKAITLFIILFVGLLLLSLAAAVHATETKSAAWGTMAAVLASLTASELWFGIAFVYTKQYLLSVREFASLEQFEIDKYIDVSRHIEVNVHGWDGLLVGRGGSKERPIENERGRTWQRFFERRGTLVLILPAVSEAEDQSEVHRALHTIAVRNGKTDRQQIDEINSTISIAKELAGAAGVVEVRWCQHLRWICTIKFDDRWLLISPYTRRHPGEPFKEPAFLLQLLGYEITRRWVDLLHRRDQ